MRNFTQADLAARADVSQGTLSRYLNGKASPKAEELLRISKALGVSMEWLLTGESTAQPAELSGIQTPAPALRKIRSAVTRLEKDVVALRESLDHPGVEGNSPDP